MYVAATVSLLVAGVGYLGLRVISESFHVLIDIEANTRRGVHFLEAAHLREKARVKREGAV